MKYVHIRSIPVGADTGAAVGGEVGVREFAQVGEHLGAACVEVGV